MTGPLTTTIDAPAPRTALRHVLREALALGASFRLSGTAVQIENFGSLPQSLQCA
jgi:hypothetical protein